MRKILRNCLSACSSVSRVCQDMAASISDIPPRLLVTFHRSELFHESDRL